MSTKCRPLTSRPLQILQEESTSSVSSLRKCAVFDTLGLDSYVPRISSSPFNNFQADISPGNLIYMIYLETIKYSIYLETLSEMWRTVSPANSRAPDPIFFNLRGHQQYTWYTFMCASKKKSHT